MAERAVVCSVPLAVPNNLPFIAALVHCMDAKARSCVKRPCDWVWQISLLGVRPPSASTFVFGWHRLAVLRDEEIQKVLAAWAVFLNRTHYRRIIDGKSVRLLASQVGSLDIFYSIVSVGNMISTRVEQLDQVHPLARQGFIDVIRSGLVFHPYVLSVLGHACGAADRGRQCHVEQRRCDWLADEVTAFESLVKAWLPGVAWLFP